MGKLSIVVHLFFLWMAVSCGRPATECVQVDDSWQRCDSSFLTVPPPPVSVTVSSVGDVMMHRWQMEKAFRAIDQTFDYSKVFSSMERYFEKSDFMVGNLETTFAGKGRGRDSSVRGYSCFPYFNAPDTFAYALKTAGFDLLSVANNHIFDSGYEGLCSTLSLLDSVGIAHVGAARSREDVERPFIVEVKGMKLGFCAYTSSTNGIYLPDSLKFSISSIEGYDSTKMSMMRREVEALKAAGADAVIALVHFGTEYQTLPNRYQRRVADSLIAYGVDVLFGSHPHIVQPMEVRCVERNGEPRHCVVFYSLGNFLSSQVWNGRISKDVGLFASVRFTKWNGRTRISSVAAVPSYTYWQPDYIGVLPVLEANARPDAYPMLRPKDRQRLKYVSESFSKILFLKDCRYDVCHYGYEIILRP
ncbi:MAG: CapA family protein [Paludibacteraceae bacterium]|nr:CapA family protein [Prevotellaceae bacterium]